MAGRYGETSDALAAQRIADVICLARARGALPRRTRDFATLVAQGKARGFRHLEMAIWVKITTIPSLSSPEMKEMSMVLNGFEASKPGPGVSSHAPGEAHLPGAQDPLEQRARMLEELIIHPFLSLLTIAFSLLYIMYHHIVLCYNYIFIILSSFDGVNGVKCAFKT